MAERCPQCYAELPEAVRWVCPTCGYTLRTPAVSKVGIVVMFLGVFALGAYVIGPANVGLTSGVIPTEFANLLVARFAEIVVGTFAFGMFLILVGALVVRRARALIAASA